AVCERSSRGPTMRLMISPIGRAFGLRFKPDCENADEMSLIVGDNASSGGGPDSRRTRDAGAAARRRAEPRRDSRGSPPAAGYPVPRGDARGGAELDDGG